MIDERELIKTLLQWKENGNKCEIEWEDKE